MSARRYAVTTVLTGLLCAGFLIPMARTAASGQTRCSAEAGLTDPKRRRVHVFCGDYTVRAPRDTWTAGQHYKVFGNLIVPARKTLEIHDSLVEIISEYPREHVVAVEGGTLSTVDTQIGGTARAGVSTQTIFVLASDAKGKVMPRWTLSNTVVQYSYGILHNAGELEAWNLQPGPSPDAIILGGASTATLHGGTFNIAVRTDARTGTDSVLDFPSNRPVTAVYSQDEPSDSGRRVPGMQPRLELDGTSVPLWFLFISNVTTTPSPQTTIRLRDVQSIIPSIQAIDFNGEMRLRTNWVDDTPKWNRTVPAGTVSTAGNIVVRTETDGTALPCWGVYLTRTPKGSTHAIIRGPTSIAELFTYEGTRAEVLGTPGTFDTHLIATTIELWKDSSVLARNVVVGSLLGRDTWGHIGAKEPGADVRFENARLRDFDTLGDSRATMLFADSIPFVFADGSQAKVSSRGKAPAFVRSAFTAASPSATLRNDLSWAGLRFRVGSHPLRVTRLGRYHHAGDASAHEIRLYKADGHVLAGVTLRASADTDYLGFNYTSLRAAITLEPDSEYILVSREGGSDRFADDSTMVTARSDDLSVVGAASSVDGLTFQTGRPNQTYGPLNFQYADERLTRP